jgi:hypothetical protein
MRFQILSDLHLESPQAYDLYEFPVTAPNLALLGDIGNVRDAGYFLFLRKQLGRYERVFVVLGNHEPYYTDFPTARRNLREFEKEWKGRLVFMDRSRCDVDERVTVLGCTLFSAVPKDQKENVGVGLNDFYKIEGWTVEHHDQAHREDLAWLNNEVKKIAGKEPHREVVIFTHHSPTAADIANNPRHKGSLISAGFMTDLTNERCWTERCVKLWGFGHTHWNCEYKDEKTRKLVVANQRGYYFNQSLEYRPERIYEV